MAALTAVLGVFLAYIVRGTLAGEYCYDYGYTSSTYCVEKCCDDDTVEPYCCEGDTLAIVWIIIGSVVGGCAVVSLIICACCCLRKGRGGPGRVLGNTVITTSTVNQPLAPYSSQPGSYPSSQPQGQGQNMPYNQPPAPMTSYAPPQNPSPNYGHQHVPVTSYQYGQPTAGNQASAPPLEEDTFNKYTAPPSYEETMMQH